MWFNISIGWILDWNFINIVTLFRESVMLKNWLSKEVSTIGHYQELFHTAAPTPADTQRIVWLASSSRGEMGCYNQCLSDTQRSLVLLQACKFMGKAQELFCATTSSACVLWYLEKREACGGGSGLWFAPLDPTGYATDPSIWAPHLEETYIPTWLKTMGNQLTALVSLWLSLRGWIATPSQKA